MAKRIPGKCVDCYSPTGRSRCPECAAFHRFKNNARGIENRLARGRVPRNCRLCQDTGHNCRTCPQRDA